MILFVVLIRAVAVNFLPKRTFLVLWWIVLLRLLIPFSLPAIKSGSPAEGADFPVLGGIGGAIDETKGFFTDVEELVIGTAKAPSGQPTPPEGEGRSIRASVFTFIWMAGAVSAAGAFALSHLRCMREFRASLPVENDFLDGWLRRAGGPLAQRAVNAADLRTFTACDSAAR